ncbi:MAG: RNA polymerase sigma factor [Planctomycetes bacterium]|nr:RNA polymerase sigma factor [Planctomycetota bacterium]
MDPQHEQVLYRGLTEGNADAWRQVYDLYARPIWRVVARLMGADSADVADVVQEAFLAAAGSVRTFDPAKGSLWLWLCGIARRHVALHYRRLGQQSRRLEIIRKMQTTSVNGEIRNRSEQESPPEAALAASELATLVRTTLTELSDEHGALLTARYLDDVSVETIAGVEQSSVAAVRSRLARARQAFRDKFRRLCSGAEDEFLGGVP